MTNLLFVGLVFVTVVLMCCIGWLAAKYGDLVVGGGVVVEYRIIFNGTTYIAQERPWYWPFWSIDLFHPFNIKEDAINFIEAEKNKVIKLEQQRYKAKTIKEVVYNDYVVRKTGNDN